MGFTGQKLAWITLIYLSQVCRTHASHNCSNSTFTAAANFSQCLEQEDPYESCPDPELCEVTNSGDNVGLAFGLTIGAGLSTTLGALLPFIPCIKRSNTLYLAAGLALAAGVMLYVSFTEIWTKATQNFCCETTAHYDLVTTACFFGGILITVALDILVNLLQKIDCGCRLTCLTGCCKKRSGELDINADQCSATNPLRQSVNGLEHFNGQILTANGTQEKSDAGQSLHEESEIDIDFSSPLNDDRSNQAIDEDAVSHVPSIGTCTSVLPSGNDQQATTPNDHHNEETGYVSKSIHSNGVSESTNNYGEASVNELFSNSSLLRMNAVIPEGSRDSGTRDVGSQITFSCEESERIDRVGSGLIKRNSYLEMVDQVHNTFEPQGPEDFKDITEGLGKDAKKLHRMGILTGLAIAIHNFPEGLATFVATLSDPSLGIALCIAIAFHNIPEGVCVAMPVYYATGKKWKGFLWAFLSGISEPLGALLGWLVLKNVFGPLVYGIAFGLISGMMVFISLKELLPTARKFDTTGGVLVNVFLVAGMVIMAISLILFLY